MAKKYEHPADPTSALNNNILALKGMMQERWQGGRLKSTMSYESYGAQTYDKFIDQLDGFKGPQEVRGLLFAKMASTRDHVQKSVAAIRGGVISNLDLTHNFAMAVHDRILGVNGDIRLQRLGSEIIREAGELATGDRPTAQKNTVATVRDDLRFLTMMVATYQHPVNQGLKKLGFNGPTNLSARSQIPDLQHTRLEHNLDSLNDLQYQYQDQSLLPTHNKNSLSLITHHAAPSSFHGLKEGWQILRQRHNDNATLRVQAAEKIFSLAVTFQQIDRRDMLGGRLKPFNDIVQIAADHDAAWLLTRAQQQIIGVKGVDRAMNNLHNDYGT